MKRLAAFVFLASSAVAIYAQAPAIKPDLKKGQATFEQVCVACHGANGQSLVPDYPHIAGQHAAYITKQLKEYQSGKRQNEIMLGMAATLTTEQDIANVAYWLSKQTPARGLSKDKAAAALGAKIYKGGLADRKIASCASCHGANGAGMPALYPRVSGQYVEYLTLQLKAFRDGARNNSPEMKAIASKMTDAEMKAVAEYMASLGL